MHYSPRIWPERDPELRLIFLSPASATPGLLRRPACLRPTTGRVGQGAGSSHSSLRARASLTRIQHSTVPLRTLVSDAGMAAGSAARTIVSDVVSPLHHVRNGTEWDPRSLRWHASRSSWLTHSARLKVRLPMAALKTLPVRFLRSLQYRRLHWVQPRHTSSSSLSVGHRPAGKSGSFSQWSHVKSVSQLGWSVETPRPALAVCCLSRVAIGSVETEAHHSICNPWVAAVEAQEPWASERGHSR